MNNQEFLLYSNLNDSNKIKELMALGIDKATYEEALKVSIEKNQLNTQVPLKVCC
jgi:hypothetical protein